jgi:TrmH family RNA methyltransferase
VVSPRLAELDPELDALLADGDTARVEDDELARLADTQAPQGVLMVVAEPRPALGSVIRAGARLLVLDAIQDPGNLGTLIRCAAAFDLDGVVALDGTVDPWNPKAVRAAAGTCFRLPVLTAPWPRVDDALVEAGLALLVADAGGTDAELVSPARGWALVVGSEAHGARRELREVADTTVAIPMPGGTESLNAGVAGGLLLYALTRAAGPGSTEVDSHDD